MTKLIVRLVFLLAGIFSHLPAIAEQASSLDAFYRVSPGDLSGPPGTLIRAEQIGLMSVYRANAYRILYVSRDLNGRKIGVSGMAVVSTIPNGGGVRPVVAWAHPTTGVARKCAPSIRSSPLAIPGMKDMIVRGYTVVATDYPGLGTSGQMPYLIGLGEALAVLDSVKAIRGLPGAQAGTRFALWGHSQGGHAALFAASLARTHAAELDLVGVAVAAPATNLSTLLDDDINSMPGRILAAMTLLSWSRNFGFPLEGLVTENTLKIVQHIDKHCIDDLGGELGALSAEQDLTKHFLNYDPDSRQPWRNLLSENNPTPSPIAVPAFIVQGAADTLVLPTVTADYVRTLCRANKAVSFRTLPGIDHSLIAEKSAAQVVNWIEDRFKGVRASSSCGR